MFEPGLLARKVVLFSGHMIDAPWADGAAVSAGQEARSGGRDGKYLTRIDTGPGDLAICGGACGGDLLFAEAALARGAGVEFYIPFDEPTFLPKSVDFADADWHDRCCNKVTCNLALDA